MRYSALPRLEPALFTPRRGRIDRADQPSLEGVEQVLMWAAARPNGTPFGILPRLRA